jgi:mono/diheme cytochrome c family protein
MTRRARLRPARATFAATLLLVAACGEDAPSGLSNQAADGRRIAATRGCAGCHGSNGQGGIGPAFVGLAGSQVELDDGTTVTADEAYLRESIVDPSAMRVAGYDQRMPEVDLSDDELDDVVQYITELGTPATTTTP